MVVTLAHGVGLERLERILQPPTPGGSGNGARIRSRNTVCEINWAFLFANVFGFWVRRARVG